MSKECRSITLEKVEHEDTEYTRANPPAFRVVIHIPKEELQEWYENYEQRGDLIKVFRQSDITNL